MAVQTLRIILTGAILVALMPAVHADTRPNHLGQTGLIHMPDGRLADDGTARFGVANMDPYAAVWAGVTLVPWLEVSGRFTRFEGVSAFGGNTGYGYYKDKAFDFKLRLTEETEWLPAIAFGRQDFHGTTRMVASFAAASKAFDVADVGTFDLTVGFGSGRFDGAFGGVRYRPAWEWPVAFVLEYDGYDYPNDFQAQRTGVVTREGGLGVGVEYTYGWLTSQISHQDGKFGLNVGFSVPLQQRTFAAKTDEPPPVPLERQAAPPPSPDTGSVETMRPIFEALRAEGFYIARGQVEDGVLRVAVGAPRFSTIGRAAGRAGRVAALLAPDSVTAFEFTFLEYNLPVATYRFSDLAAYRGWLAGTVSPPEFQRTLAISYTKADDWDRLRLEGLEYADVREPTDDTGTFYRGSVLSGWSLNYYSERFGSFRVVPAKLGLVFNDPDGVLKYDVHSSLQHSFAFNSEWYWSSSVAITLAETVSESIGRTVSNLPHVRSDAPLYSSESDRIRLNSALVGYQTQVSDRVHTWLTAGVLERMFSGAGGEFLYLPERGNWAADIQAFAVKQRDFAGRLGHQDYETITALASVHYRIPKYGVTLTARGGRFLAKDTGVRFEAKRRFLSGFEVGAWYTVTDANDITGPGRPDPYHDKGVFVRFVAGPLLPRDTSSYADFSIQPWVRDPGAMINVSGRLYDHFERRLMLNLEDLGPWSDFGH